jgi:acetyl esterase/lipase
VVVGRERRRRGAAAGRRTPPGGAERARLEPYGPHHDQVADLLLPDGAPPTRGWPVVALIHGGFWRERYRRDLMTPLAEDLAGRGWAAWNLEYRRVGGAGGWPATLTDVAAGLDHLPDVDAPLDVDAITVVGHSAGGHLALWLAGRARRPEDAPGGRPRVLPVAVVGQAPVADLRAADRDRLSDGAVAALLGGAAATPDRWRLADPLASVGHGVPVLLVHGRSDEDVPLAQSQAYAERAARAGDPVELVVGPWAHLELIDPASTAWHRVLDRLPRER